MSLLFAIIAQYIFEATFVLGMIPPNSDNMISDWLHEMAQTESGDYSEQQTFY
jgi:ribosomal protein L16 Arg81 hydroxylase